MDLLECRFAYRLPYLDKEAEELSRNRTIVMLHAGSNHFHYAEYYSLGARQSMIAMFGGGRRQGYLLADGEGVEHTKALRP